MKNNNKIQNLKPTSLVITGNLRLARHLLEEYGRMQIAAGHEAWAQPNIMHWQSWLKQSWQEVEQLNENRLLNNNQAGLVWEQIISTNLGQLTLLNLHATARSAQSAWQLVHDWGLALEDLANQHLEEDVAVFIEWAKLYRDKCKKEKWLDEARLPEHLYYSIDADQIALPEEVLLAGFDELTPIQHKIFDAIREKAINVSDFGSNDSESDDQDSETPNNPKRISLPTTREEIQTAARWTKQIVEREPEANIAIVIPQLNNIRADVVRILDQELCPAVTLPGNQDQSRPYDISLGLPLSKYPIVFDALLILECLNHRMPQEKVGRLLSSVFIEGAETESSARALLDTWLREKGATSIRMDMLARDAKGILSDGEAASYACPQLAAILTTLVELKSTMPTRQSCNDWAQFFTKVLNTFNWPGDRKINSAEYQAVESWQKVVESFAALESISGLITLSEAMSQLRNLANETIFQPEGEAVPITVLGGLEAKGLSFDYCWVLGLHDGDWPQAPRPHPFLPTRIQQELSMPHASAEKELTFAKTLTNELLASANEVIVSSPEREGDKELRPSPLINHIDAISIESLLDVPSITFMEKIHDYRELEEVTFDQPPPVFTDKKISGGTGLIKLQAQCPFSAFARYRLGAQPLAESQEGLNAMERGSLVHRVLEMLWGSIKNQETLIGLGEDELEVVILQSVAYAIDEQAKYKPEIFTPRFVEIETARLSKLMHQWLALEKQRPPFKVVAPEEEQFVTIAGMTLKVIIDRIDELQGENGNGEQLLIDYKTGSNNNLNNWFDDRPKEPQLPMYSLLGNPAALAFAQLAPGDLKFIGLGNQDGIASGIKDIAKDEKRGAADWQAQINDWRNILENIAQQYVNGDAKVDPKDDTSCTYCPYTELCRIHELNQRLGHLMEADSE